MPMMFLVIGILSIALLFAIHRIRGYQHINSVLNNAILHVEVDTALFHMQIEGFISGDTTELMCWYPLIRWMANKRAIESMPITKNIIGIQ